MARYLGHVPHYAGGTTRAHGTVFVAGEAGPEIMGHINGRTEILNRSQIAQAIYSAVVSAMGTAVNGLAGHLTTCTNAVVGTLGNLSGLILRTPAMAAGTVMPYEVAAQIARTGADITASIDRNTEDLIQTVISVIGSQTAALVAALRASEAQGQSAGGLSAEQLIRQINQRTRMLGASPLLE